MQLLPKCTYGSDVENAYEIKWSSFQNKRTNSMSNCIIGNVHGVQIKQNVKKHRMLIGPYTNAKK